jgi:putative MATE family efflux protein
LDSPAGATDLPTGRRSRRARDPVDRTIWALAVPALGSLAIEPLYATADTIIVGRLGTTELAGLAVAAQILILLAALANFLAYATTQRVAHHRGAGRLDAAATTAAQALWLAVMIGLLLAGAIAVFGPAAARILGAEGAVAEVADLYLGIRAIGLPAVLLALAAHGILRGVRDLVTPLRIVAAAAVLNVVIELVMVFGFGWGVAGAAWSTVMVQWMAAAVYLHVVRPHVRGAPRQLDHREISTLLSAGSWLVVRVSALLAALTVATAAAARLGEAPLAAHQILSTVFMVAALSLDALAIPAQTLIAEATGAGDIAAARHIGRRILRAAGVAGVVTAAIVALLAPLAPLMFSADGAVRSQATGALFVLAVLLLPGSYAFALDGILIGSGRYRALGMAMIGSLVVFLVVVIPLMGAGATVAAGLAGVWIALSVWMVARAVMTWWIWTTAVSVETHPVIESGEVRN